MELRESEGTVVEMKEETQTKREKVSGTHE